jgi:hypothetical protein
MFIPNKNPERWEKNYDIQSMPKNSLHTYNYLIKLVFNFELFFSMKFGIIYIYIYMYTAYVYTYIYLTRRKMSIVLF